MSENTITEIKRFAAKVEYKLSTAGQKAALRAGLPAQEKQIAELQITETDLDLFEINSHGVPTKNLTEWTIAPFDALLTTDTLIARLREYEENRKIQAEKKKLGEDNKKAALDSALRNWGDKLKDPNWIPSNLGPDSYTIKKEGSVIKLRWEWKDGDGKDQHDWDHYRNHPYAVETLARIQRADDLYAAKMKAAAAQKAIEDAKEAEKVEYIQNWIREHGSESQKARLEANLLPRKEGSKAISDNLYSPGDGYAIFKPLSASNLDCECSHENYEGEEENVEYSAQDAVEVGEAEFEVLENLKRIFPQSEIKLRVHRVECSECDESRERFGVLVKIKLGPLSFVREYGV